MTIKFKVVLHKDGTGGIQTDDHYFDFGGDMKALANEANRLMEGGDLKVSENQPRAKYRLTTHGHPNREWYASYTLGLMKRHIPAKRTATIEESHFEHERVFLHEFYLLNPPKILKRDLSKANQPPWIAAIDKERIRQGMNNDALKEVFGVGSSSAVGHYLSGRRPISIEQLIDVTAFLGIDPTPIIKKCYEQACRDMANRAR